MHCVYRNMKQIMQHFKIVGTSSLRILVFSGNVVYTLYNLLPSLIVFSLNVLYLEAYKPECNTGCFYK